MRRRALARVLSLTALAALSAPAACGDGGPSTPDYGPPEEDVTEVALAVQFLNPPEGVEKVQTGVLEVTLRVTDIAQDALTLVLDVPGLKTFTPLQQPLPKPGDYKVNVDTTLIPDGRKKELRATVTTVDERTASSSLLMTVDNLPPKVELIGLTPAEGGNALGEVWIQAKVTDPGSGVSQVVMRIEDFQWTWPPSGTQSKTSVDTGPIRVPTAAWTGGAKRLTVEAYDGVEGHQTVVDRDFSYVQLPTFQGARHYPLPPDWAGKALAPVRLVSGEGDGPWGLAVAGGGGLSIFVRNADTEAVDPRVELWKAACDLVTVADLNADGRDDVAASCSGSGTTPLLVLLFLQAAEGGFAKPLQLVPPAPVVAMTAGDVNDDGALDLAMATSDLARPVALSLTSYTDDVPSWSPFATYTGPLQPNLVAIGQFVPGNPRNAILVAREGWSTVTAFPVGEDGTVLSGINTLLSPETTLGVGGMMSASFAGDSARPEAALIGVTEKGVSSVYLMRVKAQDGGQPRLALAGTWLSGMKPQRLVSGDLTGDGVPEAVALCVDSDLAQVWTGTSSGQLGEFQQVLAGPSRDLALADLDGDALLDLVFLSEAGTTLSWVRWDSDAGRFAGAEMTLETLAVTDLAMGHFSKRLATPNQDMLDVGFLGTDSEGKPKVAFRVADPDTGLPLLPGLPWALLDVPAPQRIVVSNLNATAAAYPGPHDLLITSNHSGPAVGTRPNTATALLLEEDTQSHQSIVPVARAGDFGDTPSLAAVGDLDWSKSSTGPVVMDAAVLAGFWEGPAGKEVKILRVQPFLGVGDGTFKKADSTGVTLQGPVVTAARQPRDLQAFPLRRPLTYAQKSPPQGHYVDLFTANGATGDVTIFPSQGGGRYNTNSPERIKSFAMGNGPQAVAAGYLRHPLDGSVESTEADRTFPDLVTLLDTDVVVAFNTNDSRTVLETNPENLSYDPPQRLGHVGKGPVDLALADMNQDTYLDVVVLNRDSGTVTVYVNLASRAFSAPYDFPVGVGPVSMAVGDLDGNGCPDVVTADASGKTLTFLRNLVPCL